MGQRLRNQPTVTGWVNLRSFVKQHREIAIDSDIIGKGRGKSPLSSLWKDEQRKRRIFGYPPSRAFALHGGTGVAYFVPYRNFCQG